MNYQETIEYLYHATPVFEHVGASAYKPGLQTTERLDERYGHPHRMYQTIHVAGTNGKGSCSHSLCSILQEAGLRVGLYTSPHLIDFRERIRVNGIPVSEQYVVDFVEDFIQWNREEKLTPSFFELTTALAFKYFADERVDIAVIEVGLGGRLDSTNIINPLLSVITNISFDHTQFLGNTLASIAFEKAGIIKSKTPVVVGETNEDEKIEQNLMTLIDVTNWCLDGIYQSSETMGRPEYSMNKIGFRAKGALLDYKKWLDEVAQ